MDWPAMHLPLRADLNVEGLVLGCQRLDHVRCGQLSARGEGGVHVHAAQQVVAHHWLQAAHLVSKDLLLPGRHQARVP